jgi:hypothetical protein
MAATHAITCNIKLIKFSVKIQPSYKKRFDYLPEKGE